MKKAKKQALIYSVLIFTLTLCMTLVTAFCLCPSNTSATQHNQPSLGPDYYVGSTYTVHFFANGGSGSMPDATDLVDTYTLPACTFTPPTTHHQFKKWSIGGVEYSAGETITLETDITATALWELKKYAVQYNSNGGQIDMTNPMTGDLVVYGNPCTIKYCNFLPPTNCSFDYWAYNSVDGIHKNPGDVIDAVTDNIILYAIWKDNGAGGNHNVTYTITFDANGGTGEMADETVGPDDFSYTLPLYTFLPPANKRFANWSVMGTDQVPGATIQIYTDTQIIAIWEDIPVEPYTIYFLPNGGSGTMASTTTTQHTYTLPDCTFIPPSGKKFKAWTANGTTEQLPGDTIYIMSNISLRAVWENLPALVYTIKFSANGGSGTMNKVEMNAGKYTLPQCTFTPPKGKQFKHWAIGNTKKVPGAQIDIAQDVTITAIWEKASTQPTDNTNTNNGGLPTIVIVLIVLGGIGLLCGGGFGIYKAINRKKENYDWYKK